MREEADAPPGWKRTPNGWERSVEGGTWWLTEINPETIKPPIGCIVFNYNMEKQKPFAWACADYDIKPRLFNTEEEVRYHLKCLEKEGNRPVPFEGNAWPLYTVESIRLGCKQESRSLFLKADELILQKQKLLKEKGING